MEVTIQWKSAVEVCDGRKWNVQWKWKCVLGTVLHSLVPRPFWEGETVSLPKRPGNEANFCTASSDCLPLLSKGSQS